MVQLCGFVTKFLPLYYLVTVATWVADRVDGGLRLGRLCGGNVREWMSFGRRPEEFSWWPVYNNP